VREALPDSVRPRLDSLVVAYEARLAGKDSTIVIMRRTIQAQTVLLAAQDSALEDYQRVTAGLTSQRDAWKRQAQPNILKRAVALAPWLAGAYIVGRVTR